MKSGLKTWAQIPRWALVFGEISKHEIGEKEECRGPGQGARHGRTAGRTTGTGLLDDNSAASFCPHLKSRTLAPAISQSQEDRTMGLTEDKGTDMQPVKAFPEESLD